MSNEAQPAGAPGEGEITRLLAKMREGDPKAEEELLSRVYHELRALAASMMAREPPGQTLQATALVHEASPRLSGGWPSPVLGSTGRSSGAGMPQHDFPGIS
jgi:hypothetical protein